MNIDLEWQYTLLATHVQDLLNELDYKALCGEVSESLILGGCIEPIRRRMNTIKEIEKYDDEEWRVKTDEEVCEDFAQGVMKAEDNGGCLL